METKNYAYIKANSVVNLAVFEYPINQELYSQFKEALELDDIVLANDEFSVIGGTYDGSLFWRPQPYPSWTKNYETNRWDSPVPYPEIPEGSTDKYQWDESSLSWILFSPTD